MIEIISKMESTHKGGLENKVSAYRVLAPLQKRRSRQFRAQNSKNRIPGSRSEFFLYIYLGPTGARNDSKSRHTRQLESFYTTYAITSLMDRQVVDRTHCASASGWLPGSLQTPFQTLSETLSIKLNCQLEL